MRANPAMTTTRATTSLRSTLRRGGTASLLVLPHAVVQPLAPVVGFALGVGDGIDDDAIVEFMPTLVPVAFSRQIVI